MSLFLGTAAWAEKPQMMEQAGVEVTHRLTLQAAQSDEAAWMMDGGEPSFSGEFNVHIDAETGIHVAHAPLIDDEEFVRRGLAGPMLEKAVAFIHASLQELPGSLPPVVYVHCTNGVSRSATAVLLFLMRHRGMSLLEAASHVKERRRKISPNEAFVALLLAEEADRAGGEAMLGAETTDALKAVVLEVLRRPWLPDFRAGHIKLSQVDRIF